MNYYCSIFYFQPFRVRLVTVLFVVHFVVMLLMPLPVRADSGITGLGTLGGSQSVARTISGNGNVVGGWAYAAGDAGQRAFLWTTLGGMIDIGTLGGTQSSAGGLSFDGAVAVGWANTAGDAQQRAFRWTSGSGMVDLGTLGGTGSYAYDVSSDGSVVVGYSYTAGDAEEHAFRWTSGGGMVDIGTLGGSISHGQAVSADGAVVVGMSLVPGGENRAFRWTSGGGMANLGTLGGTLSNAQDASSDGSVVVGYSSIAADAGTYAFRWTSGGGMVNLGTIAGNDSIAYSVSSDGLVVVGEIIVGEGSGYSFRWEQSTGMQTVEDWLRGAGVTVPVDITATAVATNSDGSVVVGRLLSDVAYIARVSLAGSGLVTLADVQESLGAANAGGSSMLRSTETLINGAHSRPLSRRVEQGKNVFWTTGDWGQDDHGSRSGDIGLAELGIGRNFGPAQVNLSFGQTRARQDLVVDGRMEAEGVYGLAETIIPVAGNLWSTFTGYYNAGEADLKRGYLNAGAADMSRGTPDMYTWGVRGRLDWENVLRLARTEFSPYVDLSHTQSGLESYTENGGGFPARFDRRKDRATELRLGVNTETPIGKDLFLISVVEAAHRFEDKGGRTKGEVIGLFDFDLAGQENMQDWLRGGIGVERGLLGGKASLMVNATTRGDVPDGWISASWQKAF